MLASDPLSRLASLPTVAATVAQTRAAVDALLTHRMLRRRSVEVSAESALRGARASAELDGVSVSLEVLRARLLAPPAEPPALIDASAFVDATAPIDSADAGDGAVVAGAVRLHAELGTLLSTWERAPRQALARMHVLAATGRVPAGELGRPRRTAVAPDRLGLGPAPEPAVVAARLDALMDLLTTPTTAPALVCYAVVHGELLTLRPFAAASEVVARAAGRLVLVSRGLDSKSLSVPEVGHLELRDDYVASARDYASGSADGLANWVGHCGRAVALGAREGLAVCEALARG